MGLGPAAWRRVSTAGSPSRSPPRTGRWLLVGPIESSIREPMSPVRVTGGESADHAEDDGGRWSSVRSPARPPGLGQAQLQVQLQLLLLLQTGSGQAPACRSDGPVATSPRASARPGAAARLPSPDGAPVPSH